MSTEEKYLKIVIVAFWEGLGFVGGDDSSDVMHHGKKMVHRNTVIGGGNHQRREGEDIW